MSPMKAPILSPPQKSQPYYFKESAGVKGWIEEMTGEAVISLVTTIPISTYTLVPQPRKASQELIQKAAASAAAQSGMLALPGGPLALITILPDLMNIWRIQSQLVADIAALHGKDAYLGHQEMAWCLFRHAATQITRDFIVRTGQRAILSQLGHRALSAVLRKIGIRSLEHLSGRVLLRIIPLVGMGISAGYAWWDTREVGKAAIELFSSPQA